MDKCPYYFEKKTLKSFGQTMKDFSVYKEDERVFICAPMRDRSGKNIGYSKREFTGDNLIPVR